MSSTWRAFAPWLPAHLFLSRCETAFKGFQKVALGGLSGALHLGRCASRCCKVAREGRYSSHVRLSSLPQELVECEAEEKWGDYGDVEKMKQQIQNAGLDLELIERDSRQGVSLTRCDQDEPVDYSSDTDGRMFLLVFRKTASGQRRSTSWLRTRAEELKQEGNSHSP